jgi:hypothetical protein
MPRQLCTRGCTRTIARTVWEKLRPQLRQVRAEIHSLWEITQRTRLDEPKTDPALGRVA